MIRLYTFCFGSYSYFENILFLVAWPGPGQVGKNFAFKYLVTPTVLFPLAIIFIFKLILGVGVFPGRDPQTPRGSEGSNGSLYILHISKSLMEITYLLKIGLQKKSVKFL